jgi:ribosomal protein S18 acetylase RimI-like enzyme
LDLTIELTDPNSELGLLALRSYFLDVASSYYGRPATEAEVDFSMEINPSDTLAPPHGFFLVAHEGQEEVLGCIGLRFLPGGSGEVKRVFVAVQARGRGLSSRLMQQMQERALALGLTRLRLDTRHDLVAARRLYARHGFVEVPAFNDDEYAQHWFEKALVPPEP